MKIRKVFITRDELVAGPAGVATDHGMLPGLADTETFGLSSER